jgi:hypothetical protein
MSSPFTWSWLNPLARLRKARRLVRPGFRPRLEALEERVALAVLSGAQIVSTTPTMPTVGPLTTIDVTFNKAVDPSSFTLTADTAARTQIAGQIVSTPEYLTDRVAGLFQTYLRRTPTTADPVSLLALGGPGMPGLLHPFGELDAISTLVGSQEYYDDAVQGFPGPHATHSPISSTSNGLWLTQAYVDLFGVTAPQAPTTPGYSTFLSALSGGTMNRQQVALGILQQPQALANIAARIFNQVLGTDRPSGVVPGSPANVTDPDLVPWIKAFGQPGGAPPITLIQTLLGSEQFYTRMGDTQDLPSGTQPSAVALGDLTGSTDVFGNPILDLVVADASASKLFIYQGKAGGGYGVTPSLTLNLPAGARPAALAVTPFVPSGLPGIAVVNSGLTGASGQSLSIFVNTTTPGGSIISFGPRTDYNAGDHPIAIVAGNIDGDTFGDTDLAVADGTANGANNFTVSVLLGDGTGGFGAPTAIKVGSTSLGAAGLTSPTGLAIGDLNGDIKPDLAVSGSNGVVVLLNTTAAPGLPTFSALAARLTSTPTTSVAIGKVDTNASNDVVATSDVAGGELLVFQNNGAATPTFSAPSTFTSVGQAPRSVTLADLNGDGLDDVMVANDVAPGTVTVLTNTTVPASSGPDTVTFAAPVRYATNGSSPQSLAVGDVNQDVALDIVAASTGSDNFTVLPGTRPGMFQTPSDYNFLEQTYFKLLGRPLDSAGVSLYVPALTSAETVRLSGPAGVTTPLAVAPTDGTDLTYQLTFAPQTLDGTYSLTVGSSTQTAAGALPNAQAVLGLGTGGAGASLSGGPAPGGLPDVQAVLGLATGGAAPQQYAVNTSDDGRFVTGLYNDLLGHPADTQGFLSNVGPLDAARQQALAQAALGFVTSTAYRTDVINQLYNNLVGRSPTGPGPGTELTSWLNGLSNGTASEQGIEATLVGGPEYFMLPPKGNNDPVVWLNSASQDIVGRLPSTTEFNAQLPQAQTPSGRLSLALALVHGSQAELRMIYQMFVQYLGRAPQVLSGTTLNETQPYFSTLSQDYNTATGLLRPFAPGTPSPSEQALDMLLSSPEYFQHVGNSDAAWVNSLYTKLPETPQSLPGTPASTLNQLLLQPQCLAARQTVVANITSTPEYRARVVTGHYTTYLGAPPSTTDLANWQTAYQAGIRDEQVLATVLSLPSYFPLTGTGSSNVAYLNKIYNALLLRSPSTSDSTYQAYLSYLNSHINPNDPTVLQVARYNVVLGIELTDEYRRILIGRLFNTYLGTSKPLTAASLAADPDVSLMLAFMDQTSPTQPLGKTQEQVLAQLLSDAFLPYPSGATAYFLRPHLFP